MGQDISLPVIISPTGRAGGRSGWRGGRRAGRGRAGHGDGIVVVRQQADRGRHRRQPQAVLPGLLAGRARRHRRARRAGPAGRRGRADRHHRLDVLARPRLGQPEDPRADEPADHAADVAGGDHSSRGWLWKIRQDAAAAGPAGAQPGPAAARPARRSSPPTGSGWAPRRRPGKTSPGCANCGAGRSCSRA